MTILLIILAVVTIIGLGTTSGFMIAERRRTGLGVLEAGSLSWPARQIMEAFHGLPKANRPATDMLAVVKALDVRWGGCERVDKAYSDYSYYSETTNYRWGNCNNGGMNKAYKNLYDSMKDIKKALAEQEHALTMAGLAHHIDAAAELTQRMRDEAKDIRTVTEELTRDPLELA